MHGHSFQGCAGRRSFDFPFEQPSVSVDRSGTLTVPASAASATFTASAATIATSQSAVITAALGAASLTAAISLRPPAAAKPLSLSCAPAVLTPGDFRELRDLAGAPAASPTVVTLKADQCRVYHTPSLTIPAGATSGTAPVHHDQRPDRMGNSLGDIWQREPDLHILRAGSELGSRRQT